MAILDNTTVFLGSDVKLLFGSDKDVFGYKLSDTDFIIEIVNTTNNNIIKLDKSNLVKVDDYSYLILFNTNSLGIGLIQLKVTFSIPDINFKTQKRTEIITHNTDIYIVNEL